MSYLLQMVEFFDLAYIKVLLHVHKYSGSDVNGIFLGRDDAGGTKSTATTTSTTKIVDVVPLFHDIMLAPMFEIAMLQIESYCKTKYK